MVPLIELRGAIPVSQALGLTIIPSYAVCIVGTMIPVPIIYFCARRFLEWGQDKKYIDKICQFFLVKGGNAGKKLQAKAGRALFVALFLFVGIPLPGTGAWTGTLAASLLDMNFKETVIAVTLGVLLVKRTHVHLEETGGGIRTVSGLERTPFHVFATAYRVLRQADVLRQIRGIGNADCNED